MKTKSKDYKIIQFVSKKVGSDNKLRWFSAVNDLRTVQVAVTSDDPFICNDVTIDLPTWKL